MTSQELQQIIKTGETHNVEFKSSVRFDFKERRVNKELTKVISKTIAGFMNAAGGVLLIGVSDDGKIIGIQQDLNTLKKQDTDGYETHLRNALRVFLGYQISRHVNLEFVEIGNEQVAVLSIESNSKPTWMHVAENTTFYIRDGNATISLKMKEAFDYIENHKSFRNRDAELIEKTINAMSAKALPANLTDSTTDTSHYTSQTTESYKNYSHPDWLKVSTRKVLNAFLEQLSASRDWDCVHIVSPWISAFSEDASLRFTAFLNRLIEYRTTLYVTTRPPVDEWHRDAVEQIEKTGRANIALVRNLHTKLYTANTLKGSFAFMGSANLTQRSFNSHELGILVNSYGNGKPVVQNLQKQAMIIYRTSGRRLYCKAKF